MIIFWIVFILAALLAAFGFFLANFSMRIKGQTLEQARAWQEAHYDVSWADRMEKRDYTVTSFDGYVLHVHQLVQPEPSSRYIILSHGYTDNHIGSLKYAKMYLDLGFQVILYDLRGHGENEKTFCTYSIRERRDLAALIADTRARHPELTVLGLHGESLGSATSIAVLENQPPVDFVVADCGFSEIESVMKTSLPLFINETMWSTGITIMNQSMSTRGVEVVSAMNISSTASNLFFCAFFSMGSTVSIMIGQLLGAGELERAVDEDRKLIAFAVVLCTLVGALMALVAPLVPRVYNTTDTVRRLAGQFLLLTAVCMPFHGFANACYFTLRAGGRAAITFVFDSGWQWGIVIPLAFVLSRFTAVPIVPMYAAVLAAENAKCFLGYAFVRRRAWVRDLVN